MNARPLSIRYSDELHELAKSVELTRGALRDDAGVIPVPTYAVLQLDDAAELLRSAAALITGGQA